jgi:hypothetical protein
MAYSLSASAARCSNTVRHTPLSDPAAMAAVDSVPISEACRQIAPGNIEAVPGAHRLDTQPLVFGRQADRRLTSWQ